MRVHDVLNCAILFVFIAIALYVYTATSLKIGLFTMLIYYVVWEMMMRKPEVFLPTQDEDHRSNH